MATPAVLLSVPMMVIDVSLAALTAGFLFYAEVKSPAGKSSSCWRARLWPAKPEFLILIGWCAWLVFQLRFSLAAKYAVAGGAGGLLGASSCRCIQRRSRPVWLSPPPLYGIQVGGGPIWLSPIPFYGIFHALLHPFTYPPGLMENLMVPLDRMALLGMLLALAFVFHDALRPHDSRLPRPS